MTRSTFIVPDQFVARYQSFLRSTEYRKINRHAKSEYWSYHSQLIQSIISGNEISLNGKSGVYIPPKLISKQRQKKRKAISRRFRLAVKILFDVKPENRKQIQLLNYFDAFDMVMTHHPLADPRLSPYRTNHLKMNNPGTIRSVAEMRKNYYAGHKYQLTPMMVRSYYHMNILNNYIDTKAVKSVLEIGAGNGNLAGLIHSKLNEPKIIVIDLPEALTVSMVFLFDLFPDAGLIMPHEAANRTWDDAGFIFLTPHQLHLIEDNSIDLSINTASFQEMTFSQIEAYFELIQNCTRPGGWFFCSNRVEKIPSGPAKYEKLSSEPPVRFSEYPWRTQNETVVYEICRLGRLVQLDDIFNKIERVVKD